MNIKRIKGNNVVLAAEIARTIAKLGNVRYLDLSNGRNFNLV